MSGSETSADFAIPKVTRSTRNRQKANKKMPEYSQPPTAKTSLGLYLQHCQQLIQEILNDTDNILSVKAKGNVGNLTDNIINMQSMYTQIEKDVSTLEQELENTKTRLADHRAHIQYLTDNIPNLDDLKHTIKTTIIQELENQQKTQQDLEKLQNPIKDLVPMDPTHQSNTQAPSQQVRPSNMVHTTELQKDDSHRTIVIMPRNKNSFPTGSAVSQELQNKRISYPKPSVVTLTVKRNHIELLCRTIEETQAMIHDLRKDEKVKDNFIVDQKRIPLQKLIIISVPQQIKAEHIKDAIVTLTKTPITEIQILRNTAAKQKESQNWVILTPTQTAKTLTLQGEIFFGITRCRVRPYTSVLRCRKCQIIGHSSNTCAYAIRCERCGGPHEAKDCQEALNCVNCAINNRDNKTKYPLNHPSNDSTCPTYREFYNQERTKLDNIYKQTKLQVEQPNKNETPPRFQRTNATQNRKRNDEFIQHKPAGGLLPPPFPWHPPPSQLHKQALPPQFYPCQCPQCQPWSPPPHWQHPQQGYQPFRDHHRYAQGGQHR